MAGNTTANMGNLIRDDVWSRELKDVLYDDLMAQKFVRNITDFPDGDTLHIPSIGDLRVDDYSEGADIIYRPMSTGDFTFTISEYLSSGTTITKKAMQDMYYMNELVSSFVPKQRRAIMEHYETEIFKTAETVLGASANGQYIINGVAHRMSGGNSGKIEVEDFAYAWLALDKANVPQQGRVAVVSPEVAYYMNTITNLTSLDSNPKWEGIIDSGINPTGMSFVRNIYGFDVYTSNYLPEVTDSALPERDQTTTNDFSSTAGRAALFFSTAPDVVPFISAWRQPPEVDSEYDMDKQMWKYATTARYGKGLIRPENMVVVATSTAVS